MFGVIVKVIHLGTGLCSYTNYCEEKIPIFCPKKKQDIFHSSYSRHSSALISSFPIPFLAQAGRVAAGKVYCSSARLGCRSGTAVAASLPCVNSLPPLPLGQGWVRQPTKWSVSHSSVCPICSQIPSKRGTSLGHSLCGARHC